MDTYVIHDPEVRKATIAFVQEYFSKLQKESKNESRQLKAKLTKLQNKQSNLLNLLCEEKISEHDFNRQRQIYLDESIKYENRLE